MPRKFSLLISRISLSIVALSMVFLPTSPIYADDPLPAEPVVCTAPDTNQPGVTRPIGADAATYVYNCDTGRWENDHYAYNPFTGQVTAKDPVVYTYNAATGKYDSTVWLFSAPKGIYQPLTVSVSQPPAGATTIGGPEPVVTAPSATVPTSGNSITNTGSGSDNTIDSNGGGPNTINQTGADSGNAIGTSGGTTFNLNNLTNATVANLMTGVATTGSATVLGNTNAGNATSGNAFDMATIVNMLQSSSNALGGNAFTFVRNIDGDVNGDLLLDPASLGAIQSAGSGLPAGDNKLTVNNTVNAALTNDIDLTATSGDATVAQNTNAGNATSGNASAVANIINLINSAITAGQSFLGVVNINGNLNGDILLPPDFIDQLLANNVPTVSVDLGNTIGNTGASSSNTIDTTGSNNTNVTNTNNQGITNNISETSASGNATVTQNTKAGNATTGSSGNTITAFNLTGSRVIGHNALLVFVNVMGSWVGMIVNAPAGTTAAELGGGITTNTTNGGDNETTVNNTANEQITNNITLAAKTGDAAVSQNTKAGNATSGDAKTGLNLLNVANSSLSLLGWFGILFINVLGSWHGSFGVNTSAGDPVITPTLSNASGSSTAAGTIPHAGAVFRFVPHTTGTGTSHSSGSVNTGGTIEASNVSSPSSNASVLAATIRQSNAPTPTLQNGPRSIWKTAAIIGALTALYIAADALYSYRRSHRA